MFARETTTRHAAAAVSFEERGFGRRAFGWGAAAFLFLLCLASPVAAEASYGYAAQELISSGKSVEMAPGETLDFSIGFKNFGSSAWRREGPNFVSVYTHGPKYRESSFRDASWHGDVQPARVAGDTAPGQIGMFRFRLKAPQEEGAFSETFHLAAEDLAWIPGGQFTVEVRVRKAAPVVVAAPAPAPVSSDRSAYAATLTHRIPETLNLAPGQQARVTVGFRNDGSSTWLADGRHFISVYTYDPKYRRSDCEDRTWYRPDQPARLTTPSVAPGQVGEVTFFLTAPQAAGTYRETFHLAAEDLAWIPGGRFTLNVNVGSGGSVQPTTPDPEPEPVVAVPADGYGAVKMISSGDRVTLRAQQVEEFRVAFKNSGILPWVRYGSEPVVMKPFESGAVDFRAASWQGDIVAMSEQERVDPGQLGFFNVRLQAPQVNGVFSPRFALYVGERPIEGGTVDVPVEVIGGSVSSSVPADRLMSEYANVGSKGPDIRVGLFKSGGSVTFSAAGTYRLIDGRDHLPVRQLSGVTTVRFDFSTLQYTVSSGSYVYTTAYHVHLVPDNPDTTIFELISYENRAAWDRTINFNKFRGDISVHYMRSTGNLWVIETLPLEDYLRGLAETSNGSPQEYQKALVTAARTYALYVLSIGGKHKNEYHDVNTTAGDQVYKGYVSELVRPNVVNAVEQTRSSVVTYNRELVVTPYFSRSDGRTRAWTEVWGGAERPWLVSVPTPYDQGKTLWGHGVGLSASDCVGRARDGAGWVDLLKYYYRGTELMKAY